MKKLTALILAGIMLTTGFSAGVNAAEVNSEDNQIAPCYTYTGDVTSTLSINSKTATCNSYVTGLSGTTKIVVIQRLQKKIDGVWTTVARWEKTFTSKNAAYTNTKSSLSSGTYRNRTFADVYAGSNSERVKVNSTTVTI